MRLANLIGCKGRGWAAMTLYGERDGAVRPVLQIAMPHALVIRLEMSPARVAYAVQRGEVIAQENGYQLIP
jgi:hypothetical protein